MQRRALVGRLASVLAVGVLAGCSNNREVPVTAPEGPVEERDRGETLTGPAGDGGGGGGGDNAGGGRTTAQRLVMPEWEARAGPNDNLVVVVTVRNRGRSARTAVVRVVAGAGDEEYAAERFVSLDAGERTTIELAYPVSYEAFDARPSLSFDIVPRTPRTPLPTTDGG